MRACVRACVRACDHNYKYFSDYVVAANKLLSIISYHCHCRCSLMQKDPAIKPLLAGVNVDDVHSPEFGAHVLRVVVGFDLCISALNDGPVLEEITSHLAKQHAARNGVKRDYLLVSDSL